MKYRIGSVQKFLMILIALILDIIELVLTILLVGILVNRLITLIEYAVYVLWFSFNKILFTKGKSAKALWGTFVIEIIPILGASPMFTVGVAMAVKQSRIEDIEKSKNKQDLKSNNQIIRSRTRKGTRG